MNASRAVIVVVFCLAWTGCGDNDHTQNNNVNGNNNSAVCGNGIVETGEQCDDAEYNSDNTPNACRTACRKAYCGDAVVDSGEHCDDGDDGTNRPDGCPSDCAEPVCGDGHHWVGHEQCDDGNTTSGDGCRADCLQDESKCNNGVKDPGEECDGGQLGDASCIGEGFDGGVLQCASNCTLDTANCTSAICGNGFLDPGEDCDDENVAGGDGCSSQCGEEPGWTCLGLPSVCTATQCGDGIVAGDEACDDGNTTHWDGCNSCTIVEFHVSTYTGDDQWNAAVAARPDGSFVVVWSSDNQDGDQRGIYAQRFATNGSRLGAEFQVNAYTTWQQYQPDVTVAPDGSFWITWASQGQDSDGSTGVYRRFFSATGSPGSEVRVNTLEASTQDEPAIAAVADSTYIVVWTSMDQDLSDHGIYVQAYNSGNAVGSETRANATTLNSQYMPDVALSPNGAAAVVWASWGQDGGGLGIYARRFDSTGNAIGGEIAVNTYTTSDQEYPSVAMIPGGGFVVVWQSNGQDGDGHGVYAQRFDASGTRDGTEFRVNTTTVGSQRSPVIATAGDGAFVIAWQSDGQDGDLFGIYAQRFDAAGAPVGDELQVNRYIAGNQTYPALAMTDAGAFIIAWQSDGQDGSAYGVYAQRFTADGTPLGIDP